MRHSGLRQRRSGRSGHHPSAGTPSHNSAVIQSHRFGGNFAYRTDEAHAYAAISPVVSTVRKAVGVSYTHGAPIVKSTTVEHPVTYAAAPVATYAAAPVATYALLPPLWPPTLLPPPSPPTPLLPPWPPTPLPPPSPPTPVPSPTPTATLVWATVYRILGSAEIFLQHGPYGFRSCQLIF